MLADRGVLTIVVALCAWLLKRVVDATLPRGWHFRIVERWLQRGPDEKDPEDEDTPT